MNSLLSKLERMDKNTPLTQFYGEMFYGDTTGSNMDTIVLVRYGYSVILPLLAIVMMFYFLLFENLSVNNYGGNILVLLVLYTNLCYSIYLFSIKAGTLLDKEKWRLGQLLKEDHAVYLESIVHDLTEDNGE